MHWINWITPVSVFTKRKLNSLAIVFVLSFSAIAQPSVSFKWSKFQPYQKQGASVFSFKSENGYGNIVRFTRRYHSSYNTFHINHYDSNLNLLGSTHFNVQRFNERVLSIWYNKNTIYFVTQADLPNQKTALSIRIISLDLFTVTKKDYVVLNNNHLNRDLTFHVINRDSTIDVWYPNPISVENYDQSVTNICFTKNLVEKDRVHIDLPKKAELCKVQRVDLMSDNKFLICTKEYEIRPIEKRAFGPNYKFGFYLYNPDSTAMEKFYYQSSTNYLDRAKTKYKDGLLEAVGLFSDKLDGAKLGMWLMNYNFKTRSIVLDTIQFFNKATKDLPTNGYYTSIVRNSRLENFYLDYFIKLNSEDRLIIAEQFFLLPATVGSSYTYNRFFGDLLILYINHKGEIYKSHRLVKAQQTYNDFGEFSSYYLNRRDSSFEFFYNDHVKNKTEYSFKHLVWHKKSYLALSVLNQEQFTKYSLSNFQDSDGIIQASDMLELSPDKYLVVAFKKRNAKIGIMTVNH